jgi:hypothetical protein
MFPGFRLLPTLEVDEFCYNNFSLTAGGAEFNGAGGAGGMFELEFLGVFSSSNCVFSLVLLLLVLLFIDFTAFMFVTVVDVATELLLVAPLLIFCCCCCGAVVVDGFFDCQFTNSTDTNFFSRSKY